MVNPGGGRHRGSLSNRVTRPAFGYLGLAPSADQPLLEGLEGAAAKVPAPRTLMPVDLMGRNKGGAGSGALLLRPIPENQRKRLSNWPAS